MNKTKHTPTPGPWTYDGKMTLGVEGPGNEYVATVFLTEDNPFHANARLIASSPDLLAACQAAENCFKIMDGDDKFQLSQMAVSHLLHQMRTAIEKAMGEEWKP